MITEEQKKSAQDVGLDLTGDVGVEMTSGYMHFEENNSISEEIKKSKITNRRNYIETKFDRFGKNM